MINNISSMGTYSMMQSSPPKSQELSEDQMTTIFDTLSQFDPENLTEADAASIVESFSEAGIKPGRELAQAMGEYGFDPREVAELAGITGPDGNRPPPPPMNNENFDSLFDYLSETIEEALSNSETGELSDEDKENIYEMLREKFGSSSGGSIFNLTV